MSSFQLQVTPGDAAIVSESQKKTYNIMETLSDLSLSDLESIHSLATTHSKYVMADSVIRKYAEVLPEFKEIKDTSDKWKYGLQNMGFYSSNLRVGILQP